MKNKIILAALFLSIIGQNTDIQARWDGFGGFLAGAAVGTAVNAAASPGYPYGYDPFWDDYDPFWDGYGYRHGYRPYRRYGYRPPYGYDRYHHYRR